MADLYFLGDSTPSQMFGCVINTASKTIVIDGGTVGDGKQLADFLIDNANAKVDAWFFTHPHHDHIGAFYNIRKSGVNIKIDSVYHCFPSLEQLKAYDNRGNAELELWEDAKIWDKSYNVHNIKAGEVFVFDDVIISVLRVFNPNIKDNFVNNSSSVYKIQGLNKSLLILGDLGEEGGDEIKSNFTPEVLKADYTQLAHHGQNGVKKDFYEYIKPTICFWASPLWLWNNDLGDGFDTGPFNTVRTREWMAELGVIEHLIEKDGIHKIKI